MTFRERQEKFIQSHEWRRLRTAVMAERGCLCEDCLERGIIRAAEDVHHIRKLDAQTIDDPNVALNPDNLRCLCRDCHAKRHSGRRYLVRPDGTIIA